MNKDQDRNENMYRHRGLIGNTSAANSIITGGGIQSVIAFATNTVHVTAYDNSNVLRGIGGDVFIVRIENE
jgi:hypothetical protein